MGTTSCLATWLLIAAPADAVPSPAPLPPEAKQVLDDMVKDFLFDPRDAQRVRVTVPVRSVNGTQPGEREGWLVAAKGDNPARVFFIDGDHVLAPPDKDMTKVDFVADCRRLYAPPRVAPAGPEADPLERLLPHDKPGGRAGYDLVRAAWLHRLGEDALAARALEGAGRDKEVLAKLRSDLVDNAYGSLLGAFNARADEEALLHADRLLHQYAEEAKAFPFIQRIVDDLRRRQKKGTFAKKVVRDWPRGFDAWDPAKKTAFLIDALEEVDDQGRGFHSKRHNLVGECLLEAFVAVGETAIPALLDTLEKDDRLTRQVPPDPYGFGRQGGEQDRVVTVRQVALEALCAILRLRGFERVWDHALLGHGDVDAAAVAELRAYWKKYGGLPFDERMMKMLADPELPFDLKREAARNLAAEREPGGGPHPAIAKFTAPTAATAIFQTMDRDLEDHDSRGANDNLRHWIEDDYLEALVKLGDRRMAGLLGLRGLAAKEPRLRRKWTFAALRLGDDRPWRRYCDDMRTGKLKISESELLDAVRCLVAAHTPASDRTLFALADPAHPQARQVRDYLMGQRFFLNGIAQPDMHHPFAVLVLRAELNNLKATRSHWTVEGEWLLWRGNESTDWQQIPDYLRDPVVRFDKVKEKTCDAAGYRLSELLLGLPAYHPLLLDGEQVLGAIKLWFERFRGPYRLLTDAECRALALPKQRPLLVPDLKPLDRPATAADVAAGRALFHLDGKGKVAELKLPATAALRHPTDKAWNRVLIVQAETANGVTKYGIFARHAVLVVTADELDDIKPLPETKMER